MKLRTGDRGSNMKGERLHIKRTGKVMTIVNMAVLLRACDLIKYSFVDVGLLHCIDRTSP